MTQITCFPIRTQFLLLIFVTRSLTIASDLSTTRRINPVMRERIDNFVQKTYFPYIGLHGGGLAIVQNDGEIFYSTGYGYADKENGIPNGNQTQSLLGSVTKSITSVIVTKILHENFPELDEIVLDTPIRKLIPQANFTLIDSVRSKYATFRDLLSHNLCLTRDDFQILAEPFGSTTEILYRQRYSEPICGFRTEYEYNNFMIVMASELVGHLTNQSFVSYTENFLKELGMHDSTFIKYSDDFSNMPYRAKPYYINGSISHPMNPELIKRVVDFNSAGGLYATPNDMLRYMQFQLNFGKLDGKQLVPEKVMRWLLKPSNVYPDMKFKKITHSNTSVVISDYSIGLGLFTGAHNSWEKISHGGYFPPYRAELSWYPALKLGIFTSTHEAPGLIGRGLPLHVFIVEALRGNENAENIAMELVKQQKMETENEKRESKKAIRLLLDKYKLLPEQTFDKSLLSRIIGTYGNPASGEVEVLGKYNELNKRIGLYLVHGKWVRGWMERVGSSDNEEEIFKVNWDSDFVQDYYLNGNTDAIGYVTISKTGDLKLMEKWPGNLSWSSAIFQKGVKIDIDQLNPVPWKADLCK